MLQKLKDKLPSKCSFRKYACVILALLAWAVFSHYSEVKNNIADRSISVVTAKEKVKDIEIYLEALGTVTPENTVIVTPEISGKITKILFKDAQKVKSGELLAQIDDAPYKASLLQYEGQLARDMALLENAKLDLGRYQDLWKQNSISKQILDTQTSLVNQYQGTVRIDQGLVEAAKVNLSYCKITSPIDGKIGIRTIDEGNIIQTGANIAVITSDNPINIIFYVPEKELSRISLNLNNNKNIKVLAYSPNNDKLLATGELVAIDNQVNTSSGTIKLKASFKNEDKILFANQFVNIKLLIDKLSQVITIPLSALQYSEKGSFVYVVDENNKVKLTKLELGIEHDNEIVVISGLSEGNEVVIEGVDKIIDGALVKVSQKK